MYGQRCAITEDAPHLHFRLDILQAMVVQLQVVIHGTDADQRVVVGVNVMEEAGPRQLFRAEAAALFSALLEYRYIPAALR